MLKEAKEIHKQNWLKSPTPKRDHEQSWRAFKGKNLDKLIQFMITCHLQCELYLNKLKDNIIEIIF